MITMRLFRRSVCRTYHGRVGYLPASASASNKVEYLAWLHHRKVALLSLVVQPIHDTFSRYRASAVLVHPAAERQQI